MWAANVDVFSIVARLALSYDVATHQESQESQEMATTDDVVRARVGAKIKRDSEKALASMGLTMSEAIRLFLVQTVRLQALPFVIVAPNAETMQAIDEARTGKVRKHASVDALFAELES